MDENKLSAVIFTIPAGGCASLDWKFLFLWCIYRIILNIALIISRVVIMSKKTRKIDDPKDYKESSIKETMEDLEKTTEAGLNSAPELSKEHLTHGDDTSKELLYGGGGNDNKNKKIHDNNSSTEDNKS